MKKQLLKSALIAVASVGLLAGSAMATSTYWDFADMSEVTLDPSTPTDTYTYIFNLDTDVLFADYQKTTSTDIDSNDIILSSNLYIDTAKDGHAASYQFKYDGTDWTLVSDAKYGKDVDVLSYVVDDHALTVTVAVFDNSFKLQSLTLNGDFTPVPEPATMLLFGSGIAGLAGISRRRRSN